MGHHNAPDGAEHVTTVYERAGSVEGDPEAEPWWSDENSERLNLRMPEWMWDELEQHADYNQQEVSQLTREMLEYALMKVSLNDWRGIRSYGRHTYGDVQCPLCAESHPLRLRWRKQREGFTMVNCLDCNSEFSVEEGRTMESLPRPLKEVWFSFALNGPAGMDETTILNRFETFTEDPRAFAEATNWEDELTESGEHIKEMGGDAQTQKEKVMEHIAKWEMDHVDPEE